MNNENKEAMPSGVYDCRIITAGKSTRKRNEAHFVLNIGLVPTEAECERCGVTNPATYFAELPLVMAVGQEYNFYDREKKCPVVRKCVAKDTQEAVEYARKCFPMWAKFVDELPEGTPFSTAFNWFSSDEARSVNVRARLKTDAEGKYFNANIFAPRPEKSVVSEDFDKAFGNSLKAAGIKMGKAKADVGAVTAPASPSVPKPPMTSVADKSKYNCDTVYSEWVKFNGQGQDDRWWAVVSEVTGRDAGEYKSFTADEWKKVSERILADQVKKEDDDMPF